MLFNNIISSSLLNGSCFLFSFQKNLYFTFTFKYQTRKIPPLYNFFHEITSSSPFLFFTSSSPTFFFRKIPSFHDAACHLLHLHHGELSDHQHYPANVTHIMIFMFSFCHHINIYVLNVNIIYHHSVHESLSFE